MNSWRKVISVSLSCSLAGATFVLSRGAGANTAPSDICGTWALQQVQSSAELRNLRPQIDGALNFSGVRGFSLRTTWKAIDASFSLLDEGLAVARSHNQAYSVRFMAGRHTPQHVIDAGSPTYTLPTGEAVPSPFFPDGRPNTVFEAAYDEFVGRLATYSRANGVRLLHLPWYGQDWAELNHGVEVRGVPGYTYANWLNAHRRLIDIALRHAGPDLTVEFPLSGYGPLSQAAADLASHIVANAGANSTEIFVQANGWGPAGDWGAPSAAVEQQMDEAVWPKAVMRGEQMIQPQDYDWKAVYAHLYANNATYAEVYVPSFGLANKAALATEIAGFAATCGSVPTTTTTVPPVTTTTVPPVTTTTAPPTTTPPSDTTRPAVPSGLSVTSVSRWTLSLAWNAASDNVGVAGYYVFRNGALAARVTGTSFKDTGLVKNTTYGYHVLAVDAAGNVSSPSSRVWATTR